MEKNVDLLSKVPWISQFNPIVGDVDGDGDHDINDKNIACCKASKIMIQKAGFKTVNASGRVDLLVFKKGGGLEKAPTFQDGVDLLNKMLDEGKPVLVGVNRKPTSVGNANKATSHFVVIVSRTYNAARGRYEFRFLEPGTQYESKGKHESNFFFIDKGEGFLVGVSYYNAKTYFITEVRPTLV